MRPVSRIDAGGCRWVRCAGVGSRRWTRRAGPGVIIRSLEKERQVGPGTAVPVDVVILWDCAVEQPVDLAVPVRVETSDERVREISPVTLDSTPWITDGRDGCVGLVTR